LQRHFKPAGSLTNNGGSPEGVRGWLCHVLEPKVERIVTRHAVPLRKRLNALETLLWRLIFIRRLQRGLPSSSENSIHLVSKTMLKTIAEDATSV
jgi:hypothetical protein